MRPAVLALLVACSDAGEPAPPPVTPPLARDAAVVQVDAAGPVKLVGVLTAAESVDIAPRVAGKIAKVSVAEGERVTAGQTVAEMDPVQMQEELRAADAALSAASAAARQARVELEDARRKVELETKAVASGVSATSALDDAKFAVKRAEAALQRAVSTQAAEAARARTAKDHVTDTELKAPFAGTVANRYRDAGNRVEAGMPILKIVGVGSMRLRFAIPPPLVAQFPVDAKVTATVETVAQPIPATIKHVGATLDAASGMVFAEAELDSQPGELRPGLQAWVTRPPTPPSK